MGLSGPRSQAISICLRSYPKFSTSSHPNLATKCSIECDRATGLCEDQEKGVEWTRQGAPPARPTALGTHLWKTLGQAATERPAATGVAGRRRRVSAGARRRRRPSGNKVGNMPVAAVKLPAATPHNHLSRLRERMAWLRRIALVSLSLSLRF